MAENEVATQKAVYTEGQQLNVFTMSKMKLYLKSFQQMLFTETLKYTDPEKEQSRNSNYLGIWKWLNNKLIIAIY